ncbi:hypothetical protein AcW1_007402 [Taiwanofungus camphoratus]|nr:hypothetical protein AcW2_007536 [Antrodia cinnamomea]KAI0927314.1 hypothetical protein AcV5_007873 [Antrodia cinnamomea]KAI0953084.1 hypothetical protein AcW1_007402 [Antrodia cinnamomea]
MSRPSRSAMGPPPAQDIVMGPPPLPPQVAQTTSQRPRDTQDVVEKYSRLKRKYFELEEKHKESLIQLRNSGERNMKWRAERAILLDRIAELEQIPQHNPGAPIPAPPFTAFPRALLSERNQKLFVSNLRQAIDELDREDTDLDPFLLSRHIGPQARKRQEAELKERQEEEAREARRAARRPRAPQKGKDTGTPLTYAPAQSPASSGGHPTTPPVLVSSSGTRLRLKPPAPPSGEQGPPPSSSGVLNQPPHNTISAPMGQHPPHRSQSPVSPILSPQDEYPPQAPSVVTLSPSYQHAAPPPMQSQMQMTLRTTSVSSPSRPSEIQRHAKPKRLKAHTVTTKSFSIPMVPRDKKGKPMLPLNVGIMTVIDLGDVCMREHFHTERYIFPVGYEVTRRYLSTIDPNAEVVYHCTILDGGDGPKFQIVAQDMPDKPVIAGTATGAWSVIVRAANHIRNRQHSNSVSGPDFFGLGQNTIKHLIQELPNAKQLKDYVWQHFVEGGPLGGRHAAVIPALPEEHDGSGPAGAGTAYYPERGELEVVEPARDLQIIHVDSHDPTARARAILPPPPSMPQPITFHQEYSRPPERSRERRNSRASASAYDDYHGESPAQPHRPMSHSPVLHRERDRDRHRERTRSRDRGRDRSRDRFSPAPPAHATRRSSFTSPHPHHRSPYAGHNGEPGPGTPRGYMPAASPPPVPPTFASIMNAYPAPPMSSSPVDAGAEYAYANGNGGRRNGGGGER